MSNNPYHSPTAAPEKGVKRRWSVAWRRGLATGVISWGVSFVVCLLYFPPANPWSPIREFVVTLLLTPSYLVVPEGGFAFGLGILSGILLHAAFWTAVFTLWRRSAGSGGKVAEG